MLVTVIYIGIRINDQRMEYNHRRYIEVPKQIFDKYTPEEFRDKHPELFEQNPELYYSMLKSYKDYLRMKKYEQELLDTIFINTLKE